MKCFFNNICVNSWGFIWYSNTNARIFKRKALELSWCTNGTHKFDTILCPYSPCQILFLMLLMHCSRRLLGQRCGSVATFLLTLWVRIPPEAWTPVSGQWCLLLSSRGLCDWPINQLESYREWWILSVTLKHQGWGDIGPFGCRAINKVIPYWDVLCSQMGPEICYKDWPLFRDFSRFLQADDW